jgi:hypothetical protein
MNSKLSAIIFGALASAIGSAVLAFGSSLAAGYLRHRLEAWPWLFAVSILPCVVVPPSVLALTPGITRSRMRFLAAALGLAFVVTVLSASLGSVIVESFSRGLDRVNVSGYLLWCWVYGIVLLPLSFPLAILVLRLSLKSTATSNQAMQPTAGRSDA